MVSRSSHQGHHDIGIVYSTTLPMQYQYNTNDSQHRQTHPSIQIHPSLPFVPEGSAASSFIHAGQTYRQCYHTVVPNQRFSRHATHGSPCSLPPPLHATPPRVEHSYTGTTKSMANFGLHSYSSGVLRIWQHKHTHTHTHTHTQINTHSGGDPLS